MYLNETYDNYSLPGPRDTEDIFKVICSKVKVKDRILFAWCFRLRWHVRLSWHLVDDDDAQICKARPK